MRLNISLSLIAPTLIHAINTTESSANSTAKCRDIVIPVNTKAQNLDVSTSLVNDTLLEDTGVLNEILAQASQILVEGEYEIAGSYCEPTVDIPSRRNTLQILVHGLTYTRTYWQQEGNRSWVDYATSQGYPVLAVDRLCNGGSSHPNGLLQCQLPLEAAAIHGVIDAARNGALPGIPTHFNNIIYVGHSYGSLVANGVHTQYPNDINQTHLTGFSQQIIQGFSSILVRPLFLPAGLLDLAKYSSLLLDPTYLVATSYEGAKPCFFYGSYDPAVAKAQFVNGSTVTLGEVLTTFNGQLSAPQYEGDIFVVNGNEDNIFCASDLVSALAGGPGDCAEGQFAQNVQSYYPAAKNFGFHVVENIGHSILSHTTALEGIEASHKFMEQTGF